MKILYITTIGGTMNFFNSFINRLINEGHTIDIATNENDSKVPMYYYELGCAVYQINTSRSPLNGGNANAIKQIKRLVEKEKYDIVHCHTPIAAMCTRLACRKARKNGTKVIYTAHGFHFFKGAPLLNWFIYYPIEKLCSKWTDVLITINKEDFALAQKKMKAKRIEYVPGVGVDLEKFKLDILTYEERKELRASLGVSEDDKLLFSVGELNDNKNHAVILRAMAKLPDNVKYCIAGRGGNEKKLLDLAEKLGLKDRFKLLGYRKDIAELLNCTDVFCFPSKREGLPVSVIEAMACGVPVVASRIRGVVDLVIDGKCGYLSNYVDVDDFSKKIRTLLSDFEMCKKISANNCELAEKYDVNTVISKVFKIYLEKLVMESKLCSEVEINMRAWMKR